MGKEIITGNTSLLHFFENSEISKDNFDIYLDKFHNETNVPKSFVRNYDFFTEHWVNLNDEWYFFKDFSDNYEYHGTINELLGELISDYFGVDTVHFRMAKFTNKKGCETYGIVSNNFCSKDYDCVRPLEYGFKLKDDLTIFDEIGNLDIKSDCKKELLLDLKKLLIRDFYSSERDRHNMNIDFLVKDNYLKLSPLFDYEISFLRSYDKLYLYKNTIMALNLLNDGDRLLLRTDSDFQKLLYLVMLIDMRKSLSEIEDKHEIIIPENYKEEYIEHDKKIKSLVKEFKLI